MLYSFTLLVKTVFLGLMTILILIVIPRLRMSPAKVNAQVAVFLIKIYVHVENSISAISSVMNITQIIQS